MVMRFNFSDILQLMNFLEQVPDFLSWETVLFRLVSSNQAQLIMNTRINDPLGFRQFLEFKKLQAMIRQFYTNNGFLPMILEIKLKCPQTYKNQIDPNNYYDSFYLSFYSDQISTYATISYIENTKVLSATPVTAWTVYLTNIYDTWKANNGIS